MMQDDVLRTAGVTIHPALASKIASAINARSVAADMIHVALLQEHFDHDTFLYWRGVHIRESAKLTALGINVVSY